MENKRFLIKDPNQTPPQAQNNSPVKSGTLVEFGASMQLFAHALTEQANTDVLGSTNPIRGSYTSRVRELLRLKPPEFDGSNMEADPQALVFEVHKVPAIKGLTLLGKTNLASYQLMDVSQIRHK